MFWIIETVAKTLSNVQGYTRDITEFELSVPRKVSSDGELVSFKLPQFYDYDFSKARLRREVKDFDDEIVHYNIIFDGKDHHVELWPNHGFFAPTLVVENYQGPSTPVAHRKIKRMDSKQCHYVGKVKGDEGSRVALSVCDGLVGYLITKTGRFYIEPMADVQANENGEHVHIIYKRDLPKKSSHHGPSCRSGKDWAGAWEERMREEYSKRSDYGSNSNLESHHRYLETLVVADKKFLEYHKNTDYQTYIMTIMNMVSDYYHDATTGNQMDVVVVRIIYLDKNEEAFDLMINPNAEETLENFCKWQETINPADLSNPQHHDIAILLTRYDICSDNLTNCDLMGLAYVAAACTGNKPCAINEDAGLTLGVVVAHEMGHVMGCSHDNQVDSPCTPKTEDGMYHVMSPYVHLSTTVWSACSKKFITQFFENNLGDCLNDAPQESLFKDMNMPPGAVYDGNFQCNLLFPGMKATICKVDEKKFCKTLYCKTSPKSCSSNGDPPADGTKCGENKWCYNGVCQEIGKRPKAIDGGWSKWGSWSECSRTCGGGVKYSERNCNNPQPAHKGRYCIGERKKVEICNTVSCGENAISYRAVQCSSFNLKPFKDELYHWKPFLKKDDMCALYCLNEKNTYVKLAPRVQDGTNCKIGGKDKCIFGVCRKVSCDWKIDGDAVEDICGKCKGDGSTCKVIEETYSAIGEPGYNSVVTFPKDSRKITISEEGVSVNTIAIGTEDQKRFYLNGDYEEQLDGYFDFGGTIGIYEHPEVNKETLTIAGPLRMPLTFFVVFFEHSNPGYTYKYVQSIPWRTEKSKKQKKAHNYHWEFIEWETCSKRCGGGIRISKPSCVDDLMGKVSPSYCDNSTVPEVKTMQCNEDPCKYKWRTGPWGKCSGCKFQSGLKNRTVECVRQSDFTGEYDTLADDDICTGKKPASKQLCCSNEPCPKVRRSINLTDALLSKIWYQINKEELLRNSEERIPTGDKVNGRKLDRNVHDRNLIPGKITVYHTEIHTYKIKPEARRSVSYKQFANNLLTRSNDKDSSSQKNEHKKANEDSCENVTQSALLAHLSKNNAKSVKDYIPAEEQVFIEAPIVSDSDTMTLSDEMMEQLGDKVVDTLDFCHGKTYTGKEAAEIKKQLKEQQELIDQNNEEISAHSTKNDLNDDDAVLNAISGDNNCSDDTTTHKN